MGIDPFYFCVLQTKHFISFYAVAPTTRFLSVMGLIATHTFAWDFLNTNRVFRG